MNYNELIVLNNEKVSKNNNEYYCRNYNFKILPEGLNNFFKVTYLVRKSNLKENHKLKLGNVKVASNIFEFIYFLFSTFKIKNSKYFIITITPYTFISFLFLLLFKKKIFIYLISSGHEEWKYILGPWFSWVYHIMFKIVTSNSTVITLHERLYKNKNCNVITSSTLDEYWFQDFKTPKLDKIRFLYVARINPEKGIYDFLKLFKKIKIDAEISIIGKTKNLSRQSEFKKLIANNTNINFPGYISEREKLIETYDAHNILILPSYTEGQPYVVDEALARRRPVLIFEDIDHIIKGRKGVFIAKRNAESLVEKSNLIIKNYKQIQKDMEKNNLPLRKDMFEQISKIIKK